MTTHSGVAESAVGILKGGVPGNSRLNFQKGKISGTADEAAIALLPSDHSVIKPIMCEPFVALDARVP